MKTLKLYDEACSTQMMMPEETWHYDPIEELGKRIMFLNAKELEQLLAYLREHASNFSDKLNKAMKNEQERNDDLRGKES